MHVSGQAVVVSPTDLSGFLACRHLTSLELAEARGGPSHPQYDDPGREVLRERGRQHEAAILEVYRGRGLSVAEPTQPTWDEGVGGAWARLADETLDLMRSGADVVYQAGLFDGRWLARPDFLVRVPRGSDLGEWSYEVVDAKLSRTAKVGAVLQICAYSEMLGRLQGTEPERMHLALGVGPDRAAGDLDSFRYHDFAAYHRSIKARFEAALDEYEGPTTYPEPCEHCVICDWSPVCDRQWREDDHLSLVAGITRKQRAALENREVETLRALAESPLPFDPPLDGVGGPAFEKVREQARIQLQGRVEERPIYELLDPGEAATGLLALPEPTPGDLFFDIEGDPHAFEQGLEYLLGFVDLDESFTGLWALHPEEERRRFEELVDVIVARLEERPGMHVYHYAPYEPTALKRLAHRYATRESEIDRLLRGGVLVDLYRVVRQGVRASVESYSIKKLEPFYGFDRDVDLRAASSALANFEAWLQLGGDEEGGKELLEQIEGYNRDDCLSTLRLRDWLEGLRSELERDLQAQGRLDGPIPRPEPPDPEASEEAQEEEAEVRALMDALLEGVPEDRLERSPEDQARWILAYLLSWHRREDKSMWWEYFRLRDKDDDERLQDGKALAGLEYEGQVDQVKRSYIHRYRFPAQDFRIDVGDGARDPATEKGVNVWAVDDDACTIDIKRGVSSEEPHPSALIPFKSYGTRNQRGALRQLAREVVAEGLDGTENQAAIDLLLRRPPRAGHGDGAPLRSPGETSLVAARRAVTSLDHTVLPIQGPPGSGKTHIGARIVTELVRAGKRVGITASGHKVIGNLLKEVCKAAREEDVTLRAIQKASQSQAHEGPFVDRTGDNKAVEDALAEGDADLAAGTHWLWSREKMAGAVDVLVVDEAGQMSLANVLAVSRAADSVVLLGDPQQLDQPQRGVHPPGTEVSALEQLVGGETLREDRGLFLEETWRLHPDVCSFTSELYYEGRLTSRPELERQTVVGPHPFTGSGLRFVPVEHSGNTSESPEEVEAIGALLDRLLAADPTWVDANGTEQPLRLSDVLIVAPYNAQVSALKAGLPDRAQVGTVDKFQGQQAPVVVYSTASSSAEDAPRGMSFLFSPNRLNVATSRARCVAVWVGSPALLGADCRSVEQMRLANGFCRLVEVGE